VAINFPFCRYVRATCIFLACPRNWHLCGRCIYVMYDYVWYWQSPLSRLEKSIKHYLNRKDYGRKFCTWSFFMHYLFIYTISYDYVWYIYIYHDMILFTLFLIRIRMRGRYPLGALRIYGPPRLVAREFDPPYLGCLLSGSRTGKFEAGARAEEVTPKWPCSSYLHAAVPPALHDKTLRNRIYQPKWMFPQEFYKFMENVLISWQL